MKMKTHFAYIASIGSVSLTSAKNSMFGTMWECWEEGRGSNLLVEKDGKFRAVHTCTEVSKVEYEVGEVLRLIGDQSRRIMGDWKIAAIEPHTAAGLLAFKTLSRKSSIDFATFK